MGHGSRGSWVSSHMGQMGHGSQYLTHCRPCYRPGYSSSAAHIVARQLVCAGYDFDLQSTTKSSRFPFRQVCCRLTTVGKLFTHTQTRASVTEWYNLLPATDFSRIKFCFGHRWKNVHPKIKTFKTLKNVTKIKNVCKRWIKNVNSNFPPNR